MKDSSKSIMQSQKLILKRKGLSDTKLLLLITVSLFVILYILSAILFADRNFAKYSVFFNLFNNKAYLLMLALGLTIVMISGSIDISVGGVTGLVSMVIATMLVDSTVSAVWSIPVALAIGIVFGIVGVSDRLYGYSTLYCNPVGNVFARGMISVINPVSSHNR